MVMFPIKSNRSFADEKTRKTRPHFLAALRGHLSEQRGEETGVLEQNTAHNSQVGGHNHRISLCTHTMGYTITQVAIETYQCTNAFAHCKDD